MRGAGIGITVALWLVASASAGQERCLTTFEDEVLWRVNQERAQGATSGGTAYPPAPPLVGEQMLQNAAKWHSDDMALRDFVAHVNPDGDDMVDRVTAEGYPWWALAENVAAGYATPAGVVAGWMGSPGHCANIMNATYTQVGIGHARDTDDTHAPPYTHYWTMNLGLPAGTTLGEPETDCAACDDGADNDGDGYFDALLDPGCRDPGWDFEDPECDDGVDNDGDSGTDWDGAGTGIADGQCLDEPWRNRERGGKACGLGFELALALPLLAALRRTRRG